MPASTRSPTGRSGPATEPPADAVTRPGPPGHGQQRSAAQAMQDNANALNARLGFGQYAQGGGGDGHTPLGRGGAGQGGGDGQPPAGPPAITDDADRNTPPSLGMPRHKLPRPSYRGKAFARDGLALDGHAYRFSPSTGR